LFGKIETDMNITKEYAKKLLPKRDDKSNKYDFGKILVIAGSYPMAGACFLCLKSSLKAGAGLAVSVVTDKLKPIVSQMVPEAIVYSSDKKTDYMDDSVFNKVEEISKKKKFDLLLLGPGLGDDKKAIKTAVKIIRKLSLPSVIDADGINALGKTKDISFMKKIPSILTPHTGEAERFCGFKGEKAAVCMAEKTGGVVVLKDYKTIITDGKETFVLDKPNSALSKAGSGDVLCGIIAGIWAQMGKQEGFDKTTALKASICGVYIHSVAGEMALSEGSEYSVTAIDILKSLGKAFKKIKG